jgi:hypothetical protein
VQVKYFTKRLLQLTNELAIARNYNRAIDPEFVAALPEDLNFPVVFQMVHEHAAGKPIEPHMRCRVMTGQSLTGPFTDVFVDVEMAVYDILPTADVPDREKKTKTDAAFSLN